MKTNSDKAGLFGGFATRQAHLMHMGKILFMQNCCRVKIWHADSSFGFLKDTIRNYYDALAVSK